MASLLLRPRDRASRYSSLRCCSSSSTISASRAGGMRSAARRDRISSLKSGMALSGDAPDGLDQRVPAPSLGVEVLPAGGGDPVEPAPALSRFFDPPSLDQPAILEPVEERVETGDVEREHAVGERRNALGQVVPVARLVLDERQDEESRASLLHSEVEHVALTYVLLIHI